jgi:hypothetical protein
MRVSVYQADQAEKEELHHFIPSCFRAFRDNNNRHVMVRDNNSSHVIVRDNNSRHVMVRDNNNRPVMARDNNSRHVMVTLADMLW